MTLTKQSNSNNIVKQVAIIDNIKNIFSYDLLDLSVTS